MNLLGKVCVVTGASSGIGRRTALDMAEGGARVCVTARREDRLVSLVEEMGGAEAGHSRLAGDVGQRDHARALAAHMQDTYGECHVLVNNAGIPSEGGEFLGPDDVEPLERVMQTNFWGAVYCTAELLPLLRESAPANVVNVASMAGRVALGGSSSYCASKFALVGWSESLYTDLEPLGVCVSLVEPGFVVTEGFPQKDLVSDPILKYTLGTLEGVSAAIGDAIANRKMQRVEPRWYYLIQFPRLVSPPLWRLAQRTIVAPRRARRERTGG